MYPEPSRVVTALPADAAGVPVHGDRVSGSRPGQLADFSDASAEHRPAYHRGHRPPEVVTTTWETRIGHRGERDQAGGHRESGPGVRAGFDRLQRDGQDGVAPGRLVGQINGRPVFAAEFFLPIEDRLIRLAADSNPAESQRAIISSSTIDG